MTERPPKGAFLFSSTDVALLRVDLPRPSKPEAIRRLVEEVLAAAQRPQKRSNEALRHPVLPGGAWSTRGARRARANGLGEDPFFASGTNGLSLVGAGDRPAVPRNLGRPRMSGDSNRFEMGTLKVRSRCSAAREHRARRCNSAPFTPRDHDFWDFGVALKHGESYGLGSVCSSRIRLFLSYTAVTARATNRIRLYFIRGHRRSVGRSCALR